MKFAFFTSKIVKHWPFYKFQLDHFMELQTVFDFKDNHGKKDNHFVYQLLLTMTFFS